jgi:hypothetical protein
MKIQVVNNRQYITEVPQDLAGSVNRIFDAAVKEFSLSVGVKYFYGLHFIVPTLNGGYTQHQMRENWNGWHDVRQVYPDGSVRYPEPGAIQAIA